MRATMPHSTDARELGKGAALRVTSLVVSTGVALSLTPFVVHTIGDHHYGLWTIVTALSGYYALLDLGLSGAVTRHVAGALSRHDSDECNQMASTSLAMYFAVGVGVVLVSGAVSALAFLLLHNPTELANFRILVLIVGAGFGISIPMRVFFGILNASLRFDVSATLEIFSTLLRALLTVTFLRLGFGILALGWISFATALLVLIMAALACRTFVPTVNFEVKFCNRVAAKKLLSYGSISLIAQVADLLRYQMDGFIVAGFVGLAAVTHYNIGSSMATYFTGFMAACSGMLAPVFSHLESRDDEAKMKKVLYFSTKVLVALASFVAFGMIAWGKAFIARWMGFSYQDSYPVMVVLTLGLLVGIWQSSSLQLLFGVSKHGFFALFNSIEGFANLILSLILVRHYGILGVALGTMVPMMITKLCIQPWYFCKAAKLELLEYWSLLGKAIMATAVSLLLPALLSLRFALPNYGVLALIAVASVFCFAPVVLFLLFSREERQTLRTLFSGQ
jgi:O-antigen/teichoic acid export membrane protein